MTITPVTKLASTSINFRITISGKQARDPLLACSFKSLS